MDKHLEDPDETAGRRLYRLMADKLATMQLSIAKRGVRLRTQAEMNKDKEEDNSTTSSL